MGIKQDELRKLVDLSMRGEYEKFSIDQFCKTYPDLTEEDGVKGQNLRVQLMEEKGYKVVGYKLGGTSLSKINQLKATIYSSNADLNTKKIGMGRLMDYMEINIDDDLKFNELLHPKAEPEIAFVMKEDVFGANNTAAQIMWATDYITPAVEIIDSRFHNFEIGSRIDSKIDNGSAARFILGKERKSPSEIDILRTGMKMRVNEEYVGFGAGASILGHPARAVATLANMLYEEGKGLKRGDIILTGAISTSIPVKLGDYVRVDFDNMGYIEFNVV